MGTSRPRDAALCMQIIGCLRRYCRLYCALLFGARSLLKGSCCIVFSLLFRRKEVRSSSEIETIFDVYSSWNTKVRAGRALAMIPNKALQLTICFYFKWFEGVKLPDNAIITLSPPQMSDPIGLPQGCTLHGTRPRCDQRHRGYGKWEGYRRYGRMNSPRRAAGAYLNEISVVR